MSFPLPAPIAKPGGGNAGPKFIQLPPDNYEITAADHGAVISNIGATTTVTIAVAPDLPPGFSFVLLVEEPNQVTFYGSAQIYPVGYTSMAATWTEAFAHLVKGADGAWRALALSGFNGGS